MRNAEPAIKRQAMASTHGVPWSSPVRMHVFPQRRWQAGRRLGALERPVLTSRTAALVTLLLTVGLGLSVYLMLVSFNLSGIAGCSGELFDCASVLNSRWSSIGFVPVSALASGLYIALLVATALTRWGGTVSVRRGALALLAAGSFAAAFSAVYFVGLQLFVVKHLCVYCLLVHACSALLGVTALTAMGLPRAAKYLTVLVGFLAYSTLVAAQWYVAPKATYEIESFPDAATSPLRESGVHSGGEPVLFTAPGQATEPPTSGDSPESPDPGTAGTADSPVRGLTAAWIFRSWGAMMALTAPGWAPSTQETAQEPVDDSKRTELNSDSTADAPKRILNFGNVFRLDAANWPLVGEVQAQHIVVEMFDYTCSYCRANHRWVRDARAESKSDLAILCLAVPMNHECNSTVASTDAKHRDACRLAELAVAVWLAAPAKFAEFHEWLLSGQAVPSAAEATQRAESLVGKDKLRETLASGSPRAYVAKQVELYQLVGAGKVPKLLFTGTIITGDVGSSQRIQQLLRKETVGN